MNMIRSVALGATVLMAATSVSALAQSPQVPNSSGTTEAPVPAAPQQNGRQSRPLFTIGGLEVHLWAPVEPYYNANINRPIAEVPLWDNAN
jgi:hypothetical protein